MINFLVAEKNVVKREDNSFVRALCLIRSLLNHRNANKREGDGRRLFFKNLSLAKLVQFNFKESRIISFSESEGEEEQKYMRKKGQK